MTLLFAFLLNAHAGIRLIHGGGGYAEMKALTFHARIPALLKVLKEDLPVDPRYLAFTGEPTGERLVLPSTRLYDRDGQPLALEEIALAVLEVTTGLSRARAEALLRGLELRETTIALPENKLHVLALRRAGFAEAAVSVEDDEKTRDITPDLTRALNCAPSFDRHLQLLEGLHLDGKTIVVSRAVWRCGNASYTSRVTIALQGDRVDVRLHATKPCGALL